MSNMDAVNSVLTAKNEALAQQIQTAVAKKSLDAAVQLIQASAQLSKAIGKGAGFDATA